MNWGYLIQVLKKKREKERKLDRIMMDAEADALSPYEFCDRFDDESTAVCKKIHHHGPWLKEKDGLNMQEVIDTLLRESVTCEDVNDEFQLPFTIFVPNREIYRYNQRRRLL